MRIKIIFILSIILISWGCKKDQGNFHQINVYGITSKKAVVDWSGVFNNENNLSYEVFLLDSLLIETSNVKYYVINGLDQNCVYSGKIVASELDSDNSYEALFSFKTKKNKPPHEFSTFIRKITGKSISLEWEKPFDPEGDLITFSLVLDGNYIETGLTQNEFQVVGLDPSTRYSLEVIANDGHGNMFPEVVNFTTTAEGSIISYVTKYIGQREREFGIYLPSETGSKGLPLVISLHGAAGIVWPDMIKDYFVTLAENEQFILLMPQAMSDQQGNIAWRESYDIDFLQQLIDTIIVEHRVDMQRVFMTGHSNGGFMTYIMGQEIEYRLAAIGPIAGTFSFPKYATYSLLKPMPLCHIHGTADSTVQVQGNATHVSFDKVLEFFIPHNNCNYDPSIIELPDVNKNDNSTVTKLIYKNQGTSSGDIVYYRINNGNHSVPGTRSWANKDIHAYDVLWDFFKTRKLNDK